ncbi:MAG: ATP-binding cassette domain-containing protein, partial [Bacteroidota bacterium]
MHTIIGEGSSTLSGGQKQRLLIARTLVHKPRLVIFDEATSALDNRTQAIITTSLNKLQATRIVIAHRLSTIQDVDKIFVFDKGRIVQSGTYDELMAVEGPFRELAARQIE